MKCRQQFSTCYWLSCSPSAFFSESYACVNSAALIKGKIVEKIQEMITAPPSEQSLQETQQRYVCIKFERILSAISDHSQNRLSKKKKERKRKKKKFIREPPSEQTQ